MHVQLYAVSFYRRPFLTYIKEGPVFTRIAFHQGIEKYTV